MEGKPDFYPLLRKYREMDDKPAGIFRKINAVYLGMISYVDELVGRVVAALKEQGIYDDTTILLCSDHGDYAGDALQLEKWPSDMSEMVTRVPLIIRRPGSPEGQRVKTPVQSFDMLPTILDYEDVKLDYMQFGVSLRPQIEGAPGDAERAVYTEGGYDTHEPWCFEPVCFKGTPLDFPQLEGTDYYPKVTQQQEVPESVCRATMQRYRNWKLVVRTDGQNELYDLEKDPLEMENLYGRPEIAHLQTVLEQRMLRWLIHSSDVVPVYGR
jgi:choline-sulfatase